MTRQELKNEVLKNKQYSYYLIVFNIAYLLTWTYSAILTDRWSWLWFDAPLLLPTLIGIKTYRDSKAQYERL